VDRNFTNKDLDFTGGHFLSLLTNSSTDLYDFWHVSVLFQTNIFNALIGIGNYSATSNEVGTLAVDGQVGCYIWYSDEGTGRGQSLPRPLHAIPNVTAHPSTATVPITVLL